MIKILDDYIPYLILKRNEGVESYFYAKDYNIVPIRSYNNGIIEDHIIAYNNKCTNEEIKKDAIRVIENFKIGESVIIKYSNVNDHKSTSIDGSESPLEIGEYNESMMNYVCNGYSFSFTPKKLYTYIKEETQLKPGIKVEYFNNNKWNEKVISENISEEWNKTWKLFAKHNKLRH